MTERKTQTQTVRDHLLEHGRLSVHDAVFRGLEGGIHPTRVAAIIHTLRHRDGWTIETEEAPGKLAVYVLKATKPVDPKAAINAQLGAEARARQRAASSYACPTCHGAVLEVRPTLAAGIVETRCERGHRGTVAA